MKNENLLRTEKIKKVLFKMSMPAIIGMLVNSLYNIIDTIFVGQGVGALGIAGVTIIMPIQMIMMGIAQMIGIGAASMLSRNLGAKKYDKVNHIAGNAFFLLIIVGISLSFFGILFINQIVSLFGATENIFPYALEYGKIIAIGAIIFPISITTNNLLRAEGNAKEAMFSMIIGLVSNIILDYIFIFVFDMGVAGAAWATVIARLFSLVYLAFYFKSPKTRIKLKLEYLKPETKIISETLGIGVSSFARNSASSIILILMNRLLAFYGGDIAIATYGISMKIMMFLIMPVFGLVQGMQTIAGYNYGAKQYGRVIEVVKLTIIVASIMTFIGVGVAELFPVELLKLFSKNQELLDRGKNAVRIMIMILPLVGIVITGSIYTQALGKAKAALIFSLLRQVLLFLPMLLILPKIFGLTGIWMAFPVSDLGSVIIIGIYLFYEMKKLNKMENFQKKEV
ncbi:MAG: hypothetical protein B6I28_05585 [Fusobacteriia bacterium 4572_132]|nr:MAG: hypothetical protein B6I28_05585 [Fusobacteriia bacterium 4572_132]